MRPELDTLLRPLTRYADFCGRAPRTELVGLWVLISFSALLGQLAIKLMGLSIFTNYRAVHAVELAFFAPILCPMIATFVRRLRDQGRSGWWLLIGLPAMAAATAENWRELTLGWDSLFVRDPWAVEWIAIASALAVFVLLLLPPQPDPNRYGPDPGEPEPERAH